MKTQRLGLAPQAGAPTKLELQYANLLRRQAEEERDRLREVNADLLAALKTVIAEVDPQENDPRSYSGDSYLPVKFRIAVRAAIARAEKGVCA